MRIWVSKKFAVSVWSLWPFWPKSSVWDIPAQDAGLLWHTHTWILNLYELFENLQKWTPFTSFQSLTSLGRSCARCWPTVTHSVLSEFIWFHWGASKICLSTFNKTIFYQFGTFLCKTLAYCDTLSVVCSVLNLTGLSVERWVLFISLFSIPKNSFS